MTSDNETGRMIVGLDIGTNKVAAIVGEVTERNELEIKGIGTHPSRGLRKGVVVNIESTVQSIQRAVEEAELMAGLQHQVGLCRIAGSHVNSTNSHGVVAVPDREVLDHDVERVINAAEAMAIPADQKMLHVLEQEYIIDHQDGVRESSGHVRSAFGGQGSSRQLLGQRAAEHREVHRTLRPQGQRPSFWSSWRPAIRCLRMTSANSAFA